MFVPLAATAFMLFGALLVVVGANQDTLATALQLDLSDTGLLGSTLRFGGS